jgi:hypothetical protein
MASADKTSPRHKILIIRNAVRAALSLCGGSFFARRRRSFARLPGARAAGLVAGAKAATKRKKAGLRPSTLNLEL